MAPREHLGLPFWHFWSTFGGHFDISRRPWVQQDGHEVANDRISADFGDLFLSVFGGASKTVKNRFVFKLVSRSLF